ncbi:DEAD/DEAH box helicase [Terrihabitans rhizophilus]|uniref:DEAD/DEAH box helicase n=1 Tax=Terrihabitans rhizophilus TaxID=3092662 RepID=A0ABU4RRN3_9HYPH|nr:DEAD/DEAH box helicase [Terrihabitans sp. PJ23]MDX6806335.1 DEAD/DEAH box helicase [Terrihabitans sp. PJ23]
MIRELRPHQEHAIAQLRQSLAGGKRRPMIQAPTGFGKTLLAAAIVDGALRKNKRVIFCVPALSLIDQTVGAFWNEGIRDVGVIQARHEMTNSRQPVQVASVQSLEKREIPEADIVVIDEAHRWFQFYAEWMARPEWQRIPFVGLSATPWTKGLGKHFDDLITPTTAQDLIDSGFLAPFRTFAPTHPDLSGVRTKAGDYHEGDLSEAMDKPALTADVVETWRRLGENRPTFVFAVDCAHARHLRDRFVEAGVSTAYIDANTSKDDREVIERAFHAGDVRVVCNVGTMTTGVDWDVRCIVLARPTRSEMLYVQMIGRGLRIADGKSDCLILDHSDTTLKLGFVTDIHHAELDDGKPRKASASESRAREERLPKECPSCSFLKPVGLSECPSCGFKPQLQSTVKCEDGTLAEVKASKKPKAKQWTAAEKSELYGQLKGYQRRVRCSQGRTSNIFRDITGVWPNAYTGVPELEPSAGLLSKIKSMAIAYAKSQEAKQRRQGAAYDSARA